MSALDDFGGSVEMPVAYVETHSVADALGTPSTLMVNLTSMEWVSERLGGFERVILRLDSKDHEFAPDEVLAALRAQRGRLAKAKPVIVSDEETDFATGHCACGACGEPIDPWDRFCRWCGAEVDR